ncbi:N-acetyltransferase CML2 [Phytophthora nicotianae]|uniref:N-acetyltransferase CML2 n=1 Tax=Phytophthora nicotianae TaxID=4792 RepID=A0A0W8CVE9_PHYNI|nr:N-acetyltransferase CML2 [Phytophthora nicotianae]
MKRAPLLDYPIVEAVYSAMAGQAQRRASRYWLDQFAKYEDTRRPGVIKADKFTRCLNKMGIQLNKREHYEALADCFKVRDGEGDDTNSANNNKERATQLVDYAAFVDFACNVRDSEKLSEISDSLRESISKYDGKKHSSSSYNLATGLEKLDRHKRGWITSTQFKRALQREEGPSFDLSASQINTLVDRFEYEYEKKQLGIDYMQFAQWLQPLLHLDVKKVHERVKLLIEDAGLKHGWKLEEVFKAMDDDKDGEIGAVELKEALLEMGLPLTDAQIRCLTDEYDIDGDGKIQYNEFLSLFTSSGKKRVEIKKRKGGNQSDTESTTSRRNRPKRNVRNSFSWGITKAFARKQAAKSDSSKSMTDKRRAKDETSPSSEGDTSEATVKRKPHGGDRSEMKLRVRRLLKSGQ